MSLDITLIGKSAKVECVCSSCGHNHMRDDEPTLFESNITHNLNKMAKAASIYDEIWRPEECGITFAKGLIEPLTKGLEVLRATPLKFTTPELQPANGHGDYWSFVAFVEKYLNACKEHPEARVKADR